MRGLEQLQVFHVVQIVPGHIIFFFPLFSRALRKRGYARGSLELEGEPFVLMFVIVCVSISTALCMLGGFHVFLTLTNQTTIEFQANMARKTQYAKRGQVRYAENQLSEISLVTFSRLVVCRRFFCAFTRSFATHTTSVGPEIFSRSSAPVLWEDCAGCCHGGPSTVGKRDVVSVRGSLHGVSELRLSLLGTLATRRELIRWPSSR